MSTAATGRRALPWRRPVAALLAVVAVLALWQLVLVVFNIGSFVGKGPLDVLSYLTTSPQAATNREFVAQQLGKSVVDSAIGFIAGLAVALILASIFQLFQAAENAFMPTAILLQSVPLIAMAPVIILIFGRNLATVAVMGGIVVLFPALITVVFGLRSASPAMLELVAVYGGSKLTTLRKVSFPSSLPALFAAIKVSVPGAITGALLAEWLATGEGVGGAIVSAVGQAHINDVWALGVSITVVSLILYSLVGLLEGAVLRGLGMATSVR